jgi:hypothetical protein
MTSHDVAFDTFMTLLNERSTDLDDEAHEFLKKIFMKTVQSLFKETNLQTLGQKLAQKELEMILQKSSVFKYFDKADRSIAFDAALDETWQLLKAIDWATKAVDCIEHVIEAWLIFRGSSSFGLTNVSDIIKDFIVKVLPRL